jgi:NAD(P)-dependent dehydrogenase (short-subunit alcohol dehydrogenase family)
MESSADFNYRQSNYAAAKVALVGFGETLAKEGAKYNITCNILAPAAASTFFRKGRVVQKTQTASSRQLQHQHIMGDD